MSYANQIIAWTKGSFDGKEHHFSGPNGSGFVTSEITRSSLLAYHRALAGKIAWYRERIEALRDEAGHGYGRVTKAPKAFR